MTAQPHAHVRFRRAIERRALWLAEDAARELPNLPLEDAPPARPSLHRAWLAADMKAALAAAGIHDRIRPFHDLRHTAITNDAAAGANPIALKTKAGHANMATTQQYIHLAGVVFRDEAERLEARLLGAPEPSLVPVELGA